MIDTVKKALSFLEVAQQYLELSSNAATLIAQNDNTELIEDREPSPASCAEGDSLRWTDYYIGIPVIFNFYHGIELYLKGLIIVENEKPQGHRLSELLITAKELHPNASFFEAIEKYLIGTDLPPIISRFFVNASINLDDWYQAFKYPESIKGKVFDHYDLQFTGSDGTEFFSTLAFDIINFRECSVKYLSPKYEWWA